MALSQLQCLDENHVNPRILESKPEFLYCEEQRLALEALLRDGREAFVKFLEARGLRGFLSDPEQETLTGEVEPYDPGSDLCLVDGDDDEPPLSLQYWPDLSDTSVPQMDLGWPDCAAYRGVTRTNVYAQPPLDGRVHIKEIVRKTIAQAQKVIAVVMDVFTDVDIFRDLLDAGFKRRVSVYILLERTALPHFLSMCQRANMHAGHLKNLRVRCAGGVEFYSRSCSRVQGRLGHRFMFIDGDKAVSGSYSFTWMSSRLDKHLITVVTGQAVDAFDSLFRNLYMTSSTVDLRQIATDTQPEPEPLPQPAAVALPSADLARKLYSPKYALVAVGNASLSPTSSPKDSTSQNPELPETKKGRRSKAIKEAAKEAPPLHPGLANLEKAYLIPYLPTWPEPDPPSDVIGFINIRDANRPTQVHLQRSERFETSQAIRFSSPFSRPEETLPEVAQPRQFTAQCGETRKVQPTPGNTKPETSDIKPEQKAQTSGPNTPTPEPKLIYTSTHTSASEPETETLRNEGNTPALNTEHNLSPNTPTSHDATPQQSSATAATVNPTHTVTTHTPKPEPLPVSTSPPPENTPITTAPTALLPTTSTPSPSTPPVPKPRTVQLVIKSSGSSDGLDLPEPMRTPPRAPRGHHHQQQQQQQDSKAAPQSRPSQIPAGRPRGSRPSKVAQSSLQVLDNTSSACRLPPSPAPPKPAAVGVGGVGRRQSEVSPSQHSSPFSQPPAAQGRARAGQTQSQPNYPKPQASFLYTHSHLQSQLMSSQNQTDTQAQPGARQSSGPGEAPRQEEGKAFGVSFSRLYKLKGLKDRMSQPPQQSKRSSTVSPAQGHKSTG
ncbi:protein FAM83G [Diretmus argenteus]